MKHYREIDDTIWGYNTDGSQDHLITETMVRLTEEENNALFAIPLPDPSITIRTKRDNLLLETDWTQLFDVPQATIDKWQPYRQALRDVTLQAGFPETIEWPVKPV